MEVGRAAGSAAAVTEGRRRRRRRRRWGRRRWRRHRWARWRLGRLGRRRRGGGDGGGGHGGGEGGDGGGGDGGGDGGGNGGGGWRRGRGSGGDMEAAETAVGWEAEARAEATGEEVTGRGRERRRFRRWWRRWRRRRRRRRGGGGEGWRALEAPKVAAKVRSLSARCLAAAAASIGGRHSVCRALRAASRRTGPGDAHGAALVGPRTNEHQGASNCAATKAVESSYRSALLGGWTTWSEHKVTVAGAWVTMVRINELYRRSWSAGVSAITSPNLADAMSQLASELVSAQKLYKNQKLDEALRAAGARSSSRAARTMSTSISRSPPS